jgi:hypothetical protein
VIAKEAVSVPALFLQGTDETADFTDQPKDCGVESEIAQLIGRCRMGIKLRHRHRPSSAHRGFSTLSLRVPC